MSPVLEEPLCTAGSQLATEGLGKGGWADPSRSDDSPAKQQAGTFCIPTQSDDTVVKQHAHFQPYVSSEKPRLRSFGESSCTPGSQLVREGLGKGGWVDPSRLDDSPACLL